MYEKLKKLKSYKLHFLEMFNMDEIILFFC